MAINLVTFPTTPNPVAGDWELLTTLVTKSFQNINDPLQVSGTLIPEGATFQVGGNVYYCDADTLIAGTASDYVQLAVSGTTLVPTFVVDLTGVTWNKIYNGYYDANGYLYLFDETKALANGVLTIAQTKLGNFALDAHINTLNVTSDTVVTNLNADKLDGHDATYFTNVMIEDFKSLVSEYLNADLTLYLPVPTNLYRMTNAIYSIINNNTTSYTLRIEVPTTGTYIGTYQVVTQLIDGSFHSIEFNRLAGGIYQPLVNSSTDPGICSVSVRYYRTA